MNAQKQPARMGRPPRFPDEGPRTNHSLRLKPSISQALRDAAEKNMRSLAEEMEYRINMSVESEHSQSHNASSEIAEKLMRAELEIEHLHIQRQIDFSRAKRDLALSNIYSTSMRRVSINHRDGLLKKLSNFIRAKFGSVIDREMAANEAEMVDIDRQLETLEVELEASKAELIYLRAKRVDFYKRYTSFKPIFSDSSHMEIASMLYLERIKMKSEENRG